MAEVYWGLHQMSSAWKMEENKKSPTMVPVLFFVLSVFAYLNSLWSPTHTQLLALFAERRPGLLPFLLVCVFTAGHWFCASGLSVFWRCEGQLLTRGSKYLWKITTAAWVNAMGDEWCFMAQWGSDGFSLRALNRLMNVLGLAAWSIIFEYSQLILTQWTGFISCGEREKECVCNRECERAVGFYPAQQCNVTEFKCNVAI